MPGLGTAPGRIDHRLRRQRRDRRPVVSDRRRSPSRRDFERTPGGAILMDGIRLRDEIVAGCAPTIEAAGSPPVCLATVLVGDDKPSQIYVRKQAQEGRRGRHGVASTSSCPQTATQAEVEAAVAALVADPDGARHPVPAAAAGRARPRAGAGADPAREGRRRAHRAVDGPAGARPARARRLHAARRDAAARALRRAPPSGKRAIVIGRSHARRPAAGAAARPQGRRRHGHARALAHQRRRPDRRLP